MAAEQLYTIDFTLNEGQTVFTSPALAFRNIVYITREGIGMVQVLAASADPSREFFFKTTGLTAYKILFPAAGIAGGEKIHVIYK